MRRQRLALLAVILLAGGAIAYPIAPTAGAPGTPQFGGGKASKDQPQLRELTGLVLDHADAPLDQAIVYLKNTRTLVVKTFITGKDGKYRFPALPQNVDFSIYAERAGRKSDTKTLSAFDSRPQANINLRIDTGK
jgi:hypothetical protein